jgi:hypothetical protein
MSKFHILSKGMHFCVLNESHQDKQRLFRYAANSLRRSVAARLLGLWIRIPPGVWMFVCFGCCVFSGRSLCDELITRTEESYRLWSVVVCDLETSWMTRPWPTEGCYAKRKKEHQLTALHTGPCVYCAVRTECLRHIQVSLNLQMVSVQKLKSSVPLSSPNERKTTYIIYYYSWMGSSLNK